jgi:hypothetical protein
VGRKVTHGLLRGVDEGDLVFGGCEVLDDPGEACPGVRVQLALCVSKRREVDVIDMVSLLRLRVWRSHDTDELVDPPTGDVVWRRRVPGAVDGFFVSSSSAPMK